MSADFTPEDFTDRDSPVISLIEDGFGLPSISDETISAGFELVMQKAGELCTGSIISVFRGNETAAFSREAPYTLSNNRLCVVRLMLSYRPIIDCESAGIALMEPGDDPATAEAEGRLKRIANFKETELVAGNCLSPRVNAKTDFDDFFRVIRLIEDPSS